MTRAQILGATIVGPCAGDLISEITVCMQNGIGAGSIAGVMHPCVARRARARIVAGSRVTRARVCVRPSRRYPTTAEAIRQCAARFWQRPGFRTPPVNKALEMRMAEVAAANAEKAAEAEAA